MYCIQVVGGRERAFRSHFERQVGRTSEVRLIFIERELSIRRQGRFLEVREPLFRGYVFLEAWSNIRTVFGKIQNLPHFVRFLPSTQTVAELSTEDERIVNQFRAFGEVVAKSLVGFDDENHPLFIDGPLRALRERVVHLNRRKGRASVELPLGGSLVKVQLGFVASEMNPSSRVSDGPM
jgi:transcription termination/antitermination protein NusG